MPSCAMRNNAIAASGLKRGSADEKRMTLASPVRAAVVLTSQRSAANKPTLSSRVGRRSSMILR